MNKTQTRRERWEQIKADPFSIFKVSNYVIPVFLCHESNPEIIHRLELSALVKKFDNMLECGQTSFSNVMMRFENPKGDILIFERGKLISTASRTESDALEIVEFFVKKVKEKIYPDIMIKSHSIKNIVIGAKLRIPINRWALFHSFPQTCYFHPKKFPGVRMKNLTEFFDHKTEDLKRKVAALFFATGSIVITGCQKLSESKELYLKILGIIEPYLLLDENEIEDPEPKFERKNFIDKYIKDQIYEDEVDDDDELEQTEKQPLDLVDIKKYMVFSKNNAPEETIECEVCYAKCEKVELETLCCRCFLDENRSARIDLCSKCSIHE